MQRALDETDRRRTIQQAYNEKHGITPQSIKKNIAHALNSVYEHDHFTVDVEDKYGLPSFTGTNINAYIDQLHDRMLKAAADLEFEEAAKLRDEIDKLQKSQIPAGGAKKKSPRN